MYLEKALQVGMNMVWSKPVEKDMLAKLVKKLNLYINERMNVCNYYILFIIIF